MDFKGKKIPANFIFTGLIFLASIFYTVSSFKLAFGTMKSPGPGFIPRITGLMATVLSGFLLLKDIFTKTKMYADMDLPMRPILFVLCFILYAIIFKPLGYVISTIIFTFLLAKILGNKWKTALLIAVLTGAAFFIIFSLLAVPLPKGILG